MKYSLVFNLTLFGAIIFTSPAFSQAKKPNVIIIMTDDQGYGDLSQHGNKILKTPNMDRLAEESVRFTDFHVAPVCTPTRGQLLTGFDALRNGASSATGQRHLLKRGIQTIGDIFLSNGYRTAMYGKWHLGGNFMDFMPHERGFEDAVWFLRGGVQSSPNYWNNDLMDDVLYYNDGGEKHDQKQFPGYATDLWFDLGTRFLKKCKNNNEPFFLYLPLNAPHAPLLVPDQYREPYIGLNKKTATFFGMIAGVDQRLGEFLSVLEEEALRDNTILIFLTDNGTANRPKNNAEDSLPEYYNAGMRGRKGSPYEGGHRVPFFISWPGGKLRNPEDVDVLAHAQDVLPTLMDLTGIQPLPNVQFDGTSLAPLLRGESQEELDSRILVSQMNRGDEMPLKGLATVMWRKWRLVDGEELYNIEEDIAQEKNVIDQHPEIAERLKKHYDSWWEGIEPHLDLVPFRISKDMETMLTAYDWWYGPRVPNWWHLRLGDTSNGKYEVLVDEPGEYSVSLRRWPRESEAGICDAVPRFIPFDTSRPFDTYPPGKAFNITQARVRFGNQEQVIPVRKSDQEVTFRFQLPEGKADLQTWFQTADGNEFGAHYVYIDKLRE